jgi:hypothetical protein
MKPGKAEEEYFAKEEIDKKKKLAQEIKDKLQAEERENLKLIHYMHCPKCGLDLQSVTFQGFVIEKCFSCGVTVLDQNEFEKLAGTESGFISSVVGLFK